MAPEGVPDYGNLSSLQTYVYLWAEPSGLHLAYFDMEFIKSLPDDEYLGHHLDKARFIHSMNPFMALSNAEALVHAAMQLLNHNVPIDGPVNDPQFFGEGTRLKALQAWKGVDHTPVNPGPTGKEGLSIWEMGLEGIDFSLGSDTPPPPPPPDDRSTLYEEWEDQGG